MTGFAGWTKLEVVEMPIEMFTNAAKREFNDMRCAKDELLGIRGWGICKIVFFLIRVSLGVCFLETNVLGDVIAPHEVNLRRIVKEDVLF